MLGKHRPPSGNAGEPTASNLPQNVSYYDLALVVLPIPLLLGLLAGKFLSLPTQVGVSTGALLSALLVGHLLFGDPPTRRGPRRREPRGQFDGQSA